MTKPTCSYGKARGYGFTLKLPFASLKAETIAKSRPSTNMYFEEKDGKLFYLDDEAMFLYTVGILHNHPLLNILIPERLEVKTLMKFHYSKENLPPREARLQRFLEILPGLSTWTVLLGLIFFSIFFPFSAAVLIVAFYLSWILRILYSTIFLLLSYLRLNIEKKTDWMERIHGIDEIPTHQKEQ